MSDELAMTPEETEHATQHLIGVLMARGMMMMEAMRFIQRMDAALGHDPVRGMMARLELAESSLPPASESPTLHRALDKWRRTLALFRASGGP